jgi:acyl carrier protein
VKDKKQAALGDTDPLIDSGIIDSLGIMKLIGFLEDKMAIQITDEELTPENFSTIESISGLVQKKKP